MFCVVPAKLCVECKKDETPNINLAEVYPVMGGAVSWRYETHVLFDPIQDYVKKKINPGGV